MAYCGELLNLEAEMDNSVSSSSSGSTEEEDVEPLPGPSNEMKDDFRWHSDRPHPLLIPHILRDVLEQLVMKDVESCREVCRGWNDEACSIIRDKKLVALLENDAMKYYVQKMENSPHRPHTQFELHMDNLSEKQALMRTFWTSFGSQIKFLDLHQTILFLETLFQLLGERLPNLERLALRTLPRRNTRRNSHPPINLPSSSHQPLQQEYDGPHSFPSLKEIAFFWFPQEDHATLGVLKDLFQSLPNLEKISLSAIPSVMTVTRGDAMTSSRMRASKLLMRVLADPEVNLPQLTSIDFELETGNAELEALTIKGYQFRNLSLKLIHGTRSSTLKDYLTGLSPNLRVLEISFPDGYFNGGITFPAFFQMRPQEIAVHLKEVSDLSLQNFHGSLTFIKSLVRLKRLTVNNASFDAGLPPLGVRLDDARSAIANNLNDHSLVAFKTDSITSSPVVSCLSSCFPLLRVLHVKGIDDDGLGMVYRNLPYLVELVISNARCSDQGISGVPLEVCIDMAETVTFKCVNPEKYRRDLFLGSLQYLKTLRLSGEEITDVSIAFGIVDCKNLRDLTLRSSAITDTGLIKIADRMSKQLQRLDVIHCDSVTEEGKFYVKEKMKGVILLLEPPCFQRSRSAQNLNRQVGYPFRGRIGVCRPNDRDAEFVAAMDWEYDQLPMRDRLMVAMDRRRRLHYRMGQPAFRFVGREPLLYPHRYDDVLGHPPPPPHPERELGLEFMISDDEEDEMEAIQMDAVHDPLEDVLDEGEVFMPINFMPPDFMELLEGNMNVVGAINMGVPEAEEDGDDDPAQDAE